MHLQLFLQSYFRLFYLVSGAQNRHPVSALDPTGNYRFSYPFLYLMEESWYGPGLYCYQFTSFMKSLPHAQLGLGIPTVQDSPGQFRNWRSVQKRFAQDFY